MVYSPEIAAKTASLLLQIKAIKLNSREPFTWSSGWKSPIYCDNRLTLSFPEIRSFICESLAGVIRNRFPQADLIAGVATAGIAHGVLVADLLDLPFCYVRASAKGHGLGNRIEGLVVKGQKAVVIEDLISTGSSSLSVVDALQDTGVSVQGVVAIFSYAFPVAEHRFEAQHCPVVTLTDYSCLLQQAEEQKLIGSKEAIHLESWRKTPENWRPAP